MIITNDWAGWTAIYATFCGCAVARTTREKMSVLLVSLFVLFLHHAVAVTNSYIVPVIGAQADAERFHRIASAVAHNETQSITSVGSQFYISFLSFAYKVFSSSYFLGHQLSIIAFLLSLFTFIRLANIFEHNKHIVSMILLYAVLPSTLIFTSIILREAWQILFFMVAVYYGILYHKRSKTIHIMLTIIFSVVMGLFHKGLILYTPFLISTLLIWKIVPKSGKAHSTLSKRRMWASALASIATLSLVLAVSFLGPRIGGLKAVSAFLQGDALQYVATYQETILSQAARATYDVSLDTSSPISLAFSSVQVFLYYMLAPFPWQVRNPMDVYAFAESILRFALICAAIRAWRKSLGARRSILGLLLFLYFSISFMWALGTRNYGTAIRHHTVSYWILVLVGGPVLLDRIRKFFALGQKETNRVTVTTAELGVFRDLKLP